MLKIAIKLLLNFLRCIGGMVVLAVIIWICWVIGYELTAFIVLPVAALVGIGVFLSILGSIFVTFL